MDPVTLGCYPVVCGPVGLAAPRTRPLRFGAGVVVGLFAAGALPALRRLLGM
jgi:hypothetical protein